MELLGYWPYLYIMIPNVPRLHKAMKNCPNFVVHTWLAKPYKDQVEDRVQQFTAVVKSVCGMKDV